MRIRHLLLCGLLAAAVFAPTLARADSYVDPFSPSGYCKAQHLPHHHVRGMKHNPYTTCVRALTSMDKHHKLKARTACKAETHRHLKGLRGTPFSRCVAAGGHLRRGR